ncbi:MAG: peptidyl-prolyl cis-trans isomerase [Planctomycetota bacterium]|jgi:parvulin-like peptidyl-prolyl isomerase|nr:peptidyl-prolyl cis-trans isomerase [Planctomycetota bacterium]
MSKTVNYLLIASVLLATSVTSQEPNLKGEDQEGIDFIAAKINDSVITTQEVMKKIGSGFEAITRHPYLSDEEKKAKQKALWKLTLRELAEERLLQQAAEEVQIRVSQKEVEERVEEEAEKAGGFENLLRVLGERGMAIEDFREATRVRLTGQKLLLKKFGLVQAGTNERPQVDTFVSPSQVRNFYKKHRDRYHQEETAKIRQILIRPSRLEAGQKAADLARKIRQKIEAGLDFEEAARLHSHGPNAKRGGRWPTRTEGDKIVWNTVRPETLRTAVRTAVFAAQAGDLLGPIQTPVGLFVIQVVERTEGRNIPFSEVQDLIRIDLRETRIQKNVFEIKKRLIRESYIWPRDLFD